MNNCYWFCVQFIIDYIPIKQDPFWEGHCETSDPEQFADLQVDCPAPNHHSSTGPTDNLLDTDTGEKWENSVCVRWLVIVCHHFVNSDFPLPQTNRVPAHRKAIIHGLSLGKNQCFKTHTSLFVISSFASSYLVSAGRE